MSDASVPTSSASSRSSSRCGSNVPQMKRTDAVPGAVAAQPLDARLDHLRVVGEAEVVVRGEDEHLAAPLHLDDRALRRAERVEPLVGARLAQRLELRAELRLERSRHRCCHLPSAGTSSRTGSGAADGARPPG